MAARGLLDWSQADLAEKAGVGIVTVRQFEAGGHDPRHATLDVIRRAFESAGVEFIDDNGGGAAIIPDYDAQSKAADNATELR